MKLALVLTPGDDPDILDAQLAFHLGAGVDVVLVGDGSAAGAEILDRYARNWHVHRPASPLPQGGAEPTELARAAATDHGADWVIVCEPGEFWWPRAESLKDVLAAIPPRYGIVQALVRSFLPRSADDELFAGRMSVRRVQQIRDGRDGVSASALRPVYRARPGLRLGEEGADVPLRAWYPIEVFSFGKESIEVDEDVVARGLADGSLVVDARLADALSRIREVGGYALPSGGEGRIGLRAPSVVDDAAYAVECAAVREVDLAGLDRHIRELEARIAWLEQRLWPRVLRTASRVVRRSRS